MFLAIELSSEFVEHKAYSIVHDHENFNNTNKIAHANVGCWFAFFFFLLLGNMKKVSHVSEHELAIIKMTIMPMNNVNLFVNVIAIIMVNKNGFMSICDFIFQSYFFFCFCFFNSKCYRLFSLDMRRYGGIVWRIYANIKTFTQQNQNRTL